MNWAIPEGVGAWGAWALMLAVLGAVLTSQLASVSRPLAVFGGFGVGGAVSGAIGGFLARTGAKISLKSDELTLQFFGFALTGLPFLIIMLVFLGGARSRSKKAVGVGAGG